MTEKTQPTINNFSEKDKKYLYDLAYKTILELQSPLGINASGKDDRYATFFGRDSILTSLKLLRVYKKHPDEIFLEIIKKTLKTAARLQAKTMNPASGEETGKIIHEFRKKGLEALMDKKKPWFVYPDKTLRNYDSIDATPLFLILAAEFYNLTKNKVFLKNMLPNVEDAFFWIKTFGDIDKRDSFLEYLLERPEPFGGLVNQGWMDSTDFLLIHGEPPKEPVALVEVQGYYFKALKLWSEIYEEINKNKAEEHKAKAERLKEEFNKFFLMRSDNLFYFSQANFGLKAHIQEIRSNPGHCLWSSVKNNGKFESIIDDKYIPDVVARMMKPDLFHPKAGVRTLSKNSKFFDASSYHNGSIWPFDNGLIAEGFENFGFKKESNLVKQAILSAIKKFNTPIELYCLQNGKLSEWKENYLHSTRKQAWTAATILDFTT